MTAVDTWLVVAEDAPVGVLLWPVRSPEYADNFTLAHVDVVTRTSRDASGVTVTVANVVEWHYRSGTVRRFFVGEQVAVLAVDAEVRA